MTLASGGGGGGGGGDSGGEVRRVSSGLGGNLSELDSLLESLNSATFMAEIERKAGERKLCE